VSKRRGIAPSLVVVSDIHAGCQLGLFPDRELILDEHPYRPSDFQRKLWSWWREFWDEWLPATVHDDQYDLLFNGDALDGVHHKAVTQITHNLTSQREIALACLQPEVDRCLKRGGRYFHVSGTEVHVGKSAQDEEQLAKDLGAKPNRQGRHARWDLWIRVGKGLVHALHHIGITGSQAAEATAVHKELTDSFTEAGRWRDRPPDFVVRSHRHRYIRTAIAIEDTGGVDEAQAVVTPGWQGKTPHVFKIAGGRLARPQFGGIVIRQHPDGVLYLRKFVRSIERSPTE
jgi:hypothetical protein